MQKEQEPKPQLYPTKSYVAPKYGDYRHSLSNPSTNNGGLGQNYQSHHPSTSNYSSGLANNIPQQHTGMVNNGTPAMMSQKYISTKPTLTKSSKYIANKTEQSNYEKS